MLQKHINTVFQKQSGKKEDMTEIQEIAKIIQKYISWNTMDYNNEGNLKFTCDVKVPCHLS